MQGHWETRSILDELELGSLRAQSGGSGIGEGLQVGTGPSVSFRYTGKTGKTASLHPAKIDVFSCPSQAVRDPLP